jgi:hypothetical protein
MYKQNDHPCEKLLQQWQIRREVANYYFTVLLRLTPDDCNALQRRTELSQKVFEAQLSLKHASDQLQSCYQEYACGSPLY